MQFIIDLTNHFNVQNLDYLACNTLLYEHWNKYFNVLKEKTLVTIGASNDLTGNIKYGGDWVLENNNEDIRNIYFTDDVEYYQYTFAQTISTSTTITQTILNGYSWPVTINGGTLVSPVIITIGENLTISGGVNNFFIIGSNNITINGNNKIVNINNITDYPGLFENGTSLSDAGNPSFTDITIGNLGVTVTGNSSLISAYPFYGGWVCQSYFGVRAPDGIITVNNCYSTGIIGNASDDYGCGGIFGYAAGQLSSAHIVANNCYSNGTIGKYGGGIFGSYSGRSSSAKISANNCYSTGSIGLYGGGIFGVYTGNRSSAGIVANNCYSIGSIGINGGGIFGYGAGIESSKKISANNCIYVQGSSTFNPSITTQVANIWNDTNANLTINKYSPPQNVWTDISSNSTTPWLLSSFNSNIYSPNSYTGNSTYTTDPGLFQSNYTYSIFKVNGDYTIPSNIIITPTNTNNGKITFTNPSRTYTVNVLVGKVTGGNYYQYNINTFTYTYNLLSIIQQPISQIVAVGDYIILTVIAQSPNTITYLWYQNSTLILNNNSSTLTLFDADYDNDGIYYVKVSDNTPEILYFWTPFY